MMTAWRQFVIGWNRTPWGWERTFNLLPIAMILSLAVMFSKGEIPKDTSDGIFIGFILGLILDRGARGFKDYLRELREAIRFR